MDLFKCPDCEKSGVIKNAGKYSHIQCSCGFSWNVPFGQIVDALRAELAAANNRADIAESERRHHEELHERQSRLAGDLEEQLAIANGRNRTAAQAIIAAIGANGPESVDAAACRIVEQLAAARGELFRMTHISQQADAEHSRYAALLREQLAARDAEIARLHALVRESYAEGAAMGNHGVSGEMLPQPWEKSKARAALEDKL